MPALRVLPEQGNQVATINVSVFIYKAGPISGTARVRYPLGDRTSKQIAQMFQI